MSKKPKVSRYWQKKGRKTRDFFFLSSKEGRRRISPGMRGLVFAPHDKGYFSSLRSIHWFLNRPKFLVERCKLSMQCLVIFLLAQNVLYSKKHYILLCHRLKYSHSPIVLGSCKRVLRLFSLESSFFPKTFQQSV